MTVVAVLLAGGRATRMGGGDKMLLELRGRTLLDHVIARVRPQVAAMALNANGDPARFSGCGLPVVADPVADQPGPLAGVLAGMLWARAAHPQATDLLSAPTDTPFLPEDLVARLLAARAAAGMAVACACSGGRVHPVVALWPVRLAEALETYLAGGGRRVLAFLQAHGMAEAVFAGGAGDPFVNINRPEDLLAAEGGRYRGLGEAE